jgi:hypothetical protein
LIAPDITNLTWLDSCAKSWTISVVTCLQTARTHFFHSAARHDTWLQYICTKMRLTGGGIPRYIGTGRILPALLAEGQQQKYEVTRAVQGWFWRDEKRDKSAPDICLAVAAAFFGSITCSRPAVAKRSEWSLSLLTQIANMHHVTSPQFRDATCISMYMRCLSEVLA